MGLLFLTEHLGHVPDGPFFSSDEELCRNASSETVELLTASKLEELLRPRQQHEIPPKIWLVATANSKTTCRGIGDIENSYIVRCSGRTLAELFNPLDAISPDNLHD